MTTSNPSCEKNPIRLIAAFRALWRLARDNDDTTHVFAIVDALRGDSDIRNVERLRALPEGSLGRIYLAFMAREGITANGLAAAADEGYSQRSTDPDVRTFAVWARDSHDLWHVLTGYGRDPLGELCLLGVLHSQIYNPGTAFIALLGLLQVPFEYPGAPSVRAVLQGFAIGRRAEWMIAQDWEALLELPIDEVRARLGLARPTYYERSAPLHDAARSRSRAAASQAVAA
jgi:ubiquinone biosynthesis protein COQ4